MRGQCAGLRQQNGSTGFDWKPRTDTGLNTMSFCHQIVTERIAATGNAQQEAERPSTVLGVKQGKAGDDNVWCLWTPGGFALDRLEKLKQATRSELCQTTIAQYWWEIQLSNAGLMSLFCYHAARQPSPVRYQTPEASWWQI